MNTGERCEKCECGTHDHAECAGYLRDSFAELGWDVDVSTAPPAVVTEWTTAPFICPHGVAHWPEPTIGQLAELYANRERE